MFVVSSFATLTASLTGLLGTALGLVVYVPVIWTSYKASGDDSGPPQITFGEYLRQHAFEWEFWALLVAGLVTAMLYWFPGKSTTSQKRSTPHDDLSSPTATAYLHRCVR